MPRKESSAAFEQETSLSQADTEPLSFEDENETAEVNGTMTDLVDEDAPGSIQASPADTSMEDVNAITTSSDVRNHLADNANEQDDEGDDADAVGSDEEDQFEDSKAQETTNEDDTGTMQRSNTGAAFSDDSELTDESDDDEDAEGEAEEEEEDDDDEMGGDDEDDEDEDAEGEEEEEDDEDEAAKGLAALTAAAEQNGTDQNAGAEGTSGLDGLAVLAAAGASDADQLNVDGSDSESTVSSRAPSTIPSRHGRLAAKPRLGSRLNEVMLASEPTSDQDDLEDGEEDEEGAGENDLEGNEQEDDESQGSHLNKRPKNHSRAMSSLGHLATAAKRSATRPGAAAGLLAGAPSITIDEAPSGAASVASSREGSPKLDDKEDEDGEQKDTKGEEEDEDDKEKGVLETPILETEEAVAEEETSTDEAAIKRQEAMEALTKIEIGFAVLRDKLYVERMDEISKESEMILEGTHPDLIYLTNFIEARRERRLKLVEMWFEEQQKQYERVAHTEEAAAWNNWRNEVVQLRKDRLDDISRKRRKLDREKRTLDGPRPARRHQIFETELVRNPDYDAAQAKAHGKSKRKNDPRQQELEDLEEMGAYVAYPDLRGAEEGEAWMDLERMGVQPDVRLMPGMNYYRMDEMGVDPYGNMYVMDGGAQQPPPGMELMPPFAGGPAPGGMMLERGGFDGHDRGMPPGMVVDGYGPAPPANQFGGPHPPAPRGNGPARMQNDIGMGGANQASSSKKRAGTPSGIIRTPKQSGAVLDDRVGRKNEGQNAKRPRSPGQAPGSRKPVGTAGPQTSNSNRNISQNVSQRNFDGMIQGNKMPYAGGGGGGPPRDIHDERYYDGPLPPAHMGGQPPPGAYGGMSGHGGGKMPPGAGAGFPPGHMMGSPGQPVSQQLGPAPPQPQPPMNHSMHGPPSGFPPNRRSDAIYPH